MSIHTQGHSCHELVGVGDLGPCPKRFTEQGDRRGGKGGASVQSEPTFPSDDKGPGREFG